MARVCRDIPEKPTTGTNAQSIFSLKLSAGLKQKTKSQQIRPATASCKYVITNPKSSPPSRPVPCFHSLPQRLRHFSNASLPSLPQLRRLSSIPTSQSPKKRCHNIPIANEKRPSSPSIPENDKQADAKKKEIPGHRWRGWDPKRPHLFHITSPHPSSTLIETQEQRRSSRRML